MAGVQEQGHEHLPQGIEEFQEAWFKGAEGLTAVQAVVDDLIQGVVELSDEGPASRWTATVGLGKLDLHGAYSWRLRD
jgi:hypothetical protein